MTGAKTMKFQVEIDHRENDERIQEAAYYYKSKGDDVKVKELLVGDYVFNNQVFNQAIDQSSQYPYHFVIIVASDNEKEEYLDGFDEEAYVFGWDNYDGAIARLNTFTTVKECSTEERAIRFMRQQARKCLDNKKVVKRLKQKTDNPAFNWLALVKHIGDDTAELIVENKNLYSLTDLLELDNNSLQEIKGIGSKTAGIVMRSIKGKRRE